jgi:hypothetical protein
MSFNYIESPQIDTLSGIQSMLTPQDRKLFGGTAAEVHDWMTTDGILSSINANFAVASVPAHYQTMSGDWHESSSTRIWYRNDTGEQLGSFGTKRRVIQPAHFVNYFRSFCDQSEKQISLDLVGTLNGGKTFYMASKLSSALTDNFLELRQSNLGFGIQKQIPEHDRTDFWLVLTDFYGQSIAPRVVLLANRLICSNGMTQRVRSKLCSLSHLKQQNTGDVHAVLRNALMQSDVYYLLQDRLMNIEISMDTARAALRSFFNDENSEKRKTQAIERIYEGELIGDSLDTTQANGWRLLNSLTQYNSHTGRSDASRLHSQIQGTKAIEPHKFLEHLANQFDQFSPLREVLTAERELVLN